MLDGKTEWFLVTFEEILNMIERVKLFMVRMFNDCGSDHIIEAPRYNLRSRAV